MKGSLDENGVDVSSAADTKFDSIRFSITLNFHDLIRPPVLGTASYIISSIAVLTVETFFSLSFVVRTVVRYGEQFRYVLMRIFPSVEIR